MQMFNGTNESRNGQVLTIHTDLPRPDFLVKPQLGRQREDCYWDPPRPSRASWTLPCFRRIFPWRCHRRKWHCSIFDCKKRGTFSVMSDRANEPRAVARQWEIAGAIPWAKDLESRKDHMKEPGQDHGRKSRGKTIKQTKRERKSEWKRKIEKKEWQTEMKEQEQDQKSTWLAMLELTHADARRAKSANPSLLSHTQHPATFFIRSMKQMAPLSTKSISNASLYLYWTYTVFDKQIADAILVA